jgi:predicted Zn-dependent protease
MSVENEPRTNDLKVAVTQAMRLLSAGKFDLAEEQATEILRLYPDEVNSQFIIAAVLRARGSNADALNQLQELVDRAPDFALAQQELGFASATAGEPMRAIEALQKATAVSTELPGSWRLMAELFFADGDDASANEAMNQHLLASSEDPDLVNAVTLLRKGQVGQAESLARKYLIDNPTDVTAIRLLADIGAKVGVLDEAETLLVRCLELAPDFDLARLNYANVLNKREKLEEALQQITVLLEKEPDRFAYRVMEAGILIKMGDFDRALPAYQYLVDKYPPRPKITLSLGHALKTVGRLDESIASYRQSISLQPSFGDAYWSLANLKTFRFGDDDIDSMRCEIEEKNGSQEDYFHLCFALGKALQDREQYDESFHYFNLGNELKEKIEGYSADETTDTVSRIINTCTSELFAAKKDMGHAAGDPIFIVGLPRSGSTLLEQILASHSQVDGTKELIHILAFARRLSGKRKKSDVSRYPDALHELNSDQLQELGQEFLDRSQVQRGSAPFFIDKAPNNFLHTALIKLILPNAKIIDARRHPMGSCFSCYTQLFARGQSFTYGLSNIGRYFCDYVRVMDHWDEVIPGQILRVQYEDVVADLETQVRRILDYCNLPFEENCLEFYRTDRAIRTPSSEQVRQPIYTGALDLWRNYDAHLDALKASLAPVLDRYPID